MHAFPALAVLLLAAPAMAQQAPPGPGTVLSRILDHACIELVEDSIGCEGITLVHDGNGGADLHVHPHPVSEDLTPLIVVPDAVFSGPLFGQQPQVEPSDADHAFRLHSENIGIGRSPWERTLQIAYRDGEFLIAGETFVTWDRTNADSLRCDVNLRTGAWELDITRAGVTVPTAGRDAARHVRLREHHLEAPLPPRCARALEAWWQGR